MVLFLRIEARAEADLVARGGVGEADLRRAFRQADPGGAADRAGAAVCAVPGIAAARARDGAVVCPGVRRVRRLDPDGDRGVGVIVLV